MVMDSMVISYQSTLKISFLKNSFSKSIIAILISAVKTWTRLRGCTIRCPVSYITHFTLFISSWRIHHTLKLNWAGRLAVPLCLIEMYCFVLMQGIQELFFMVLINNKKALAFNLWVLTISQRWRLREKESKTKMEELILLEECKDNS